MKAFEEVQKLSAAIVYLTYAILIFTLVVLLFTLEPTGDPVEAYISIAAVFLVVTAFFTTMKMTTEVTSEGVHINTLYFISRLILFEEIDSADAIQYKPLLDYGGWGVRISHKGKAYNLRGKHGVQLHLKNGGRVLIGSQREQELAMVINAGLK